VATRQRNPFPPFFARVKRGKREKVGGGAKEKKKRGRGMGSGGSRSMGTEECKISY